MTADKPTDISKNRLKAKTLQASPELEVTGQPVVVNDPRYPVSKMVPTTRSSTVQEVFGPFHGALKFHEQEMQTAEQDEDALQ